MSSESMLEVFNEMHRLKNENERLQAELAAQAVRIDQLVEVGAFEPADGVLTVPRVILGAKMKQVTLHVPLTYDPEARADAYAKAMSGFALRLANETPMGSVRYVETGPRVGGFNVNAWFLGVTRWTQP